MRRTLAICYEIITPCDADACDGDHDDCSPDEDRGFLDEGSPVTIDEAIRELSRHCLEPSSGGFHPGIWYSDADGDIDYSTGAEERHSYHLRGFTPREQRWIYDAVTR